MPLSYRPEKDPVAIIIASLFAIFILLGILNPYLSSNLFSSFKRDVIVEDTIEKDETSKSKKITLEEAAALMRGKLKDINQGLLDYKVISVDGYDAYIFLSRNMGPEDLWCIQTATTYLTSEGQLDVVSGDCGISNRKRREWENF